MTTLRISIAVNILLLVLSVSLIYMLFDQVLDGTPARRGGGIAKLKSEVIVTSFEGNKSHFRIPEGIVVRECDATGMGWFEPHRFMIIFTSDREDILSYDGIKEGSSEFYSVKLPRNKTKSSKSNNPE